MTKNRIIISLTALLAIFTVKAQSASRYELNVKDFSELTVIDGINVDYRAVPDSAGKAVFYATADLASAITFANDNRQKLEISLSESDSKVTYANLPRVTVYSKFLTKVENRGDSTVRVMSVSSGPRFKAHLEGNGRLAVHNADATLIEGAIFTGSGVLTIDGSCTSAKLNNKGVGSIQADGLSAEIVKCVQMGPGYIGCKASSELTVIGAAGKVYYHGNPKVKNRSIGVKLISLDNEE